MILSETCKRIAVKPNDVADAITFGLHNDEGFRNWSAETLMTMLEGRKLASKMKAGFQDPRV